jgi:hypothetical protein
MLIFSAISVLQSKHLHPGAYSGQHLL